MSRIKDNKEKKMTVMFKILEMLLHDIPNSLGTRQEFKLREEIAFWSILEFEC